MNSFFASCTEFFLRIGISADFIPLAYAISIMLILLVTSILVNALNLGLIRAFPGNSGIFICRWLTFPGVILHESSHAFFALITGAKIEKIVFFKPEGNTLGYVSYRPRGGVVSASIQRMLSSVAPMIVGPLVLIGMFNIFTLTDMLWLKILSAYVAISMFMHMDLSGADIKEYLKGCGIVLLIVLIVCLL